MSKKFTSLIRETWADICNLVKGGISLLKKPASPWWLVGGLLILVIVPYDAISLETMRVPENSPAHKVAQFISDKGDFYKGCALLVAVLFTLGLLLKKQKLRLLALAMALSCAFAGISSLAIRITSGRPRPSLGVADGLYGPKFDTSRHGFAFFNYDYQSFPSGHATTAFATVIPALVVEPVIGFPLTIAAATVPWARFQLKRHHLSDLYAGIFIGTVFGVVFGRAAKKIYKA